MNKTTNLIRLGDAATFINGFAFKPTQWGESGIPIIRIQNLNNPVAPFNYFDGDVPNKYLVKKGDILISWSASLGAYEWTGEDAYLNQHIFKVVFDKADIDKHFLKYAVTSKLSEMDKDAHGATMRHIVKKDFDNTKIPFPPLTEQQHIVEELDLLSSIIEKKKAQLNELDNLAQSLFYEMFGDPITNENGWEVDMLENVVANDCTISYGIVQPGDDVLDGIPVVRPVDLVTIVVEREGLKRVAKDISDSYKRTILKGGEILLCVRGTTGIMSFASSNLAGCNVTRGITPLAFGDKLNKYYAFCYLKSKHIQDIIADNTRGATLKQINMKDVRQLPMLIPPIDLQNQFASKIEAIEHQKELIKQSIKEVETLFNSRMDYYFN